ncbi:hypothetical protein A0J61_09242 [Choanephora cucurbitarum]|uniref:F-box domain-containing protein n=1 Tax=Choanephora cucurbitarum TaxID=101091 RepID=A0A1C7N138_9FUNG|nr:hypothetical protein A0J61_09242 [Choanephora cucurbitarum]
MTLILSSKSLFKRLQLKKSNKKPDRISCLPRELLVCIYQQLQTPDCTRAFAATSRLFRQIALQPHSKAAWIVTRLGPRYALYYALLNLPDHCTGQFIQSLFHLGAQVPRCLLQALIQHYGKPVQDLHSDPRRRQDPFPRAIQRLSFDGYATIIQRAHLCYRPKLQSTEDLSLFLTALTDHDNKTVDTMVSQEWFLLTSFTARKTTPMSYPAFVQLLQSEHDRVLAPIFEFDPVARFCLWEACLMILFEEAFRSSELTAERKALLEHVSTFVSWPASFLDDRSLFCQAFSNFFTKYPKGYCQASTMNRLINLLYRYAQPACFHLPMALEHIIQAQMGREDTIQHIQQFLQTR